MKKLVRFCGKFEVGTLANEDETRFALTIMLGLSLEAFAIVLRSESGEFKVAHYFAEHGAEKHGWGAMEISVALRQSTCDGDTEQQKLFKAVSNFLSA